MEKIGLKDENNFAHKMNPSDMEQVIKDLSRLEENLEIVNEITSKTYAYRPNKLKNKLVTNDAIDLISNNNNVIKGYLERYLHQGGFLHAGELLLSIYFRIAAKDSDMIRLDITNKKSKFILQKDGSIIYEESFNISEIMQDRQIKGYKPKSGEIASIQLRSKIYIKDGILNHDFSGVEITAHDDASKKLFLDPRSPFIKFTSWVKDKVTALFNKAAREHQKALKAIKSTHAKL